MIAQAVFFDAGGTIIYPEPSVGEVYAGALRDAGTAADAREVQRAFEAAWQRLRRQSGPGVPAYGATESEARDWWRLVVRESFAPFGRPADFEGVFLRLWEHFASADAWRVYEDVMPAFEALERREVGIGLISNWDVRLRPILDQLALLEHFHWVLISCEVGAEKPDKAIFQHALKMCAFPPDEVVHVGDGLEEDACGALAAGLQAVWLNREHKPLDSAADAHVIMSLTELPSLLG